MKKDDWYGLGFSLVLHAIIFVIFGVITMAASRDEKPRPQYIEIEMGSIRMGNTVDAAGNGGGGRKARPIVKPEPPPKKAVATNRKGSSEKRTNIVRKTVDQPKKRTTPTASSKQVNTPKKTPKKQDTEVIKTPKTDNVSPTEKASASDSNKKRTEPEERESTRNAGSNEDQAGTNASSGRAGSGVGEGTGSGTGTSADAGSGRGKGLPFSIEGLNRGLVSYGLPRYVDPINATVRVRITVDPAGRVTGVRILQKGSAALDRAVNSAVRNWKFSPLPENAPQKNQDGTVTFRFRLE